MDPLISIAFIAVCVSAVWVVINIYLLIRGR